METGESFLKSPKVIKHNTLGALENYESFYDQSEFKLFFNCYRQVNIGQLHDHFGKCLFLLTMVLRKVHKEDNSLREIKKFSLNLPVSQHQEENRIAVPLQGVSIQEEVDNSIKNGEFCFTEGLKVFEDGDPEKLSIEHLDPEKTFLDFEFLIKGTLYTREFQPFLTELINHVIIKIFFFS